MKVKIKRAKPQDSSIVRSLINEMYGFEYEVRSEQEIANSIKSADEIYILSYLDDVCIGFAGATVNHEEYKQKYGYGSVIDYIYVKEKFRGAQTAYNLIMGIIKQLVSLNINEAVMQVQTFNKQRYLHYALSDKNIINSEVCKRKGDEYEDQILLIKDLKSVQTLTLKQLMQKIVNYKNV